VAELPANILGSVPPDAWPAVERWWSSLTDGERQEAASLWDERREVCFFHPQRDAAGRLDDWRQLPIVEGGRFVPHDDSVRLEEWLDDWIEYLAGHEEVILLPRVVVVLRTFHICESVPAARAVVVSGLLPAGFACPLQSVGCPMRRVQLLAPQQALHLTPARAGGWWLVAPWRVGGNPAGGLGEKGSRGVAPGCRSSGCGPR
jgi:hypothetical protein